MCGIAGILGLKDNRDALVRMVRSLRHRGPDDEGTTKVAMGGGYLDLGNTRLAIIDLSPLGHMPMQDRDTKNWITFNGEIYNYRDLRGQLETLGDRFESQTDTEVVLKAYQRWGTSCVERFRGMFAFAIWDHHKRQLFLARDRLGKKPLYYARTAEGCFVFASEVRTLLASGLISAHLDPRALEAYLFNGFVIAPLTLVKGVRSLLPGHWMCVDEKGEILEIARYWSLTSVRQTILNKNSAFEPLRHEVEDAVRLRMVSDVPIGAFLSGGLDSSAVVALMAKIGGEVKTFAVTFDESRFDESLYSNWVAKRFNTNHAQVRLTQQDFSDNLGDAVGALDQPSFDGMNTYFVSKAARQTGLTVALSGLGGDEIFGGYPFFQSIPALQRCHQCLNWTPRRLAEVFERWYDARSQRVAGPWKTLELLRGRTAARGMGVIASYQTAQVLFPFPIRRRLLVGGPKEEAIWFGLPTEFIKFVIEDLAETSGRDAISRLALRIFLGERCLRDTDSTSMAVSLEVRAPFTDHALVETALSISDSIRCAGSPDKRFEKELVMPYLGADYPYRKKQGFVFPFELWLRDSELQRRVEETILDKQLAGTIGLSESAIKHLVLDYRSGRSGIPWSRLWALYVLFEWCKRYRVSR